MYRRSLRKKFCHLPHAESWVVETIILVMVITLITIISVTIMIIDSAVFSVT